MQMQPGLPSVTVHDVAQKLADNVEFVLLDVREMPEWQTVNLGEKATLLPLSDLARRQADAIPEALQADKDQEIVVYCHHGSRSAQVVAWLRHLGWTNVWNMSGGIDQYALWVDQSLPRY